MCDGADLRDNYWAMNIFVKKVPTSYVGMITLIDRELKLNGTYYLYSAHVLSKYTVRVEGL